MSDEELPTKREPVKYEPVTFGGDGLHPDVRELGMHRIIHLSYEEPASQLRLFPVLGEEG